MPACVRCFEGFAGGCRKLTEIKVSSENTLIDSRNDCNAVILKNSWTEEREDGTAGTAVVHSGGDSLTQGCKNTVIPSDVYAIGSSALSYLDIEEILIPEGVHRIEISGVDKGAVFVKGKDGTYNNGEVEAKSKGTLRLMCLADGKKKTVCAIKVEQTKLKPKLKLKVGASKLTGTKRTADKWESSDPAIAAVSATGAVTGVKAGSVTVTACIGELKSSGAVLVK